MASKICMTWPAVLHGNRRVRVAALDRRHEVSELVKQGIGRRDRHLGPLFVAADPDPVFYTLPDSRLAVSKEVVAACLSYPRAIRYADSYKRLVPGFEAPTILALSARNRSATCRIPVYFPDPHAKRVEFRPPGSQLQPVPRLLSHAHGRAGRH